MANGLARLLHEGQSIDAAGDVEGEPPQTDTLGFRWSGINNLFLTAGDLAADEWRASQSVDEENAEREMRQFVWCLPSVPPKFNHISVEADEIVRRTLPLRRGVIPSWREYLTCGVDLGKYLTHWIVVAWGKEATGHVVDYGRVEVPSHDVGIEQGLMIALRQMRDMFQAGWPVAGEPAKPMAPDYVWIDAGYMASLVYAFCRETGDQFRPAIGRGASQQRQQWYNRPTSTGNLVKHIGDGYHINWLVGEKLHLIEVDADRWKTWVHARLTTPRASPGALSLHEASPREHLALAKHLTAEAKVEEFVAGKGAVQRWERLRRQNHWFDCLYLASAAAHLCGVRLIEEPAPLPSPRRRVGNVYDRLRGVDGSPWVDLSQWRPIWERDRE